VVLVKTGAETHGLNMEQRFVELSFVSSGTSPTSLAVRMPSRAADVPPGYYLLFVLNAQGVPSRARIVFINVAAPGDAGQDPTLAPPADRTGAVGALESLALDGSDPNAGTVLSYAAAGLPAGLSLNPATGVIGGTPTAPGDYHVVVSASDGTRTATANFLWSIGP
jgi:hypothetical protein